MKERRKPHQLRLILIESELPGKQSSDMANSEAMLEPRVSGAGVDQVSECELPQMPQTLKRL
jgi:hypothetical protein